MKRTMSLMQEYKYILSSILGLKKKVEKLENSSGNGGNSDNGGDGEVKGEQFLKLIGNGVDPLTYILDQETQGAYIPYIRDNIYLLYENWEKNDGDLRGFFENMHSPEAGELFAQKSLDLYGENRSDSLRFLFDFYAYLKHTQNNHLPLVTDVNEVPSILNIVDGKEDSLQGYIEFYTYINGYPPYTFPYTTLKDYLKFYRDIDTEIVGSYLTPIKNIPIALNNSIRDFTDNSLVTKRYVDELPVTWEKLSGNQDSINLQNFKDGYKNKLEYTPLHPDTNLPVIGMSKEEDVILIASMHSGKMEKSIDGGQSWNSIPLDFQNVSSITKTNTGVWYLTTGESSIYRSNDDGETWIKAGNISTETLQAIPDTTDGCLILSSNFNGQILEIHKFKPTGHSRKFYLSTLQSGYLQKVGNITTNNNGTFIFSYIIDENLYLCYSTDDGETWTTIDTEMEFSTNALPIDIDEHGKCIIAGGEKYIVTITENFSVFEKTIIDLEYPETIKYGGDGNWLITSYYGFSLSKDGGETWERHDIRDLTTYNTIRKNSGEWLVGVRYPGPPLIVKESVDLIFENIVNEYQVNGQTVDIEDKVLNIKTGVSYQLDENLTGGTWIDGKPIYRRVLTIDVGEYAETHSINLLPLNIDFLIDVRIIIIGSEGGMDATKITTEYARIQNGSIMDSLEIMGGVLGTMKVILEYTKK